MLRLSLLTAALTLALATPALADSIAYVQGGNVFLSTPDGARKVQVTPTGIYSSVSQADDGTMIALAPGERLHKLSRDGKVLADFLTPISDGAPTAGPVNKFHGPFNPQISPDGTKVAYEYFNDSYETAPGCSETTVPPCVAYKLSKGTLVSNTDGFTPLRDVRPAVGLDLADLARQPDAAALGPGRHPQRRRRDQPARRRPIDRWFYDHNQGLGVIVDGAVARPDERDRHRGLLRREAARLPHDDEPVRRAGLGPHAVHQQGQRPDRPAVLGADRRQVPEHVDGADRQGVRLRHRRRRLHHRDPGQLRAGRPGDAGRSRARSRPTGVPPTSRPRQPAQPTQPTQPTRPGASKPKLKLAKRKGGFSATLTTGAAGKATLKVTPGGKKKSVTIGKSGKVTVTFKAKRGTRVTVKATFGGQTVSAKLRA